MDLRRAPRFSANQPIVVTVLGEHESRHAARVRNASGRGLGLELGIPLPTGTALKIELDDSILLGEVMYCRYENSFYFVGVELEHALLGLAEFAKTLLGFEEPSGVKGAHAVDHRKR
jgi:hypothetical protein